MHTHKIILKIYTANEVWSSQMYKAPKTYSHKIKKNPIKRRRKTTDFEKHYAALSIAIKRLVSHVSILKEDQ